MKPGKHQRSKQRCQDLGWKVHDRAQSFANNYHTLCKVKVKKANKKPTTMNFVGFHNHSLY